MNVADSQRMRSYLEHLGYHATRQAEDADVIVLNTCVVRQSAEDRAVGRLSSLQSIKKKRPYTVINLMGCLVGVKNPASLHKRFPYVDVFSPPSDPAPLIDFLTTQRGKQLDQQETAQRNAILDGDLLLPVHEQGTAVTAFLPIVYGCSYACTYCIIPYRRGSEASRPLADILHEAQTLTDQGIREITLLGQIVDRYGLDIPGGSTLPDLLRALNDIDGLERIRFLTSHPKWMSHELIDTVATLPKVCEHIEVPIQAGDDNVLTNMKRGYTSQTYRDLVTYIRKTIPGASIGTDIIVGFPAESSEQFEHTYELLAELKLDVVHLARYSERPGTVAARRMPDDVPEEEKVRRFRLLEDLQAGISQNIHNGYLDQEVEVLVETTHRGKWKGRTRTNKLVFIESDQDLSGQLVHGRVTWAGPWSLQADLITVEVTA